MNKTVLNVKIATIIQFILCLIFAFAIWISVKYSDMYSKPENANQTEEITETADASCESNFIEV